MTTRQFVRLVTLLAIASAAALWYIAPPSADFSANTVATLGLLALTAELLAFLLPRGAKGSISFVPYMTALVLVPNFAALCAIGGASCLAAIASRRDFEKTLFNLAQLLLSYSIAIVCYRSLGGRSLFEFQHSSTSEASLAIGAPLAIAYAVVFSLNTLLVSRVVAISTSTPTLQVWRENSASTIGLDILALPLVFAFAWVYSRFGAMFASLLWLPVLGLRQMNTANVELAQTNRELLQLMVKSIEARDPYTSGHSRRVQQYAIQIARLIGLSAQEVERIGTAALLHDVGKIYEKYGPILAKEDRLTPEEWAVIKEHPADGANLIATMTTLRKLVPSVRHHHENWDGTGYPDGLRGENIPLSSRIIMFADTLDAMTTKRPYRGPLGEQEVRSELVRCSGRQFDPEIAKKLLDNDFWTTLFPPSDRSSRVSAGFLRLMVASGKK